MSKFSILLRNEHKNEHKNEFPLKRQFSIPKIYDAGGDLSKRWYVYYTFRNPKTNRLTPQNNVYAGVNNFKNLKDRRKAIEILRQSVQNILESGYNPYQEIEPTNQEINVFEKNKKTFTLKDAINKYQLYLSGHHEYAHKRKVVSKAHREEAIRFCNFFSETISKNEDVDILGVDKVTQKHVAEFYLWAEGHYSPKTFNKCMAGLRAFFQFLINIEEVEIKNPFETYVSKAVEKKENETLTKSEFQKILKAVDNYDPIVKWGKGPNAKNRSMYHSYLKDGFKLFLLTGGRREEVVDLKWSDIFITSSNVMFFKILNLKVERSNNSKNVSAKKKYKYIPINNDLMDLLIAMGYEEKKHTSEHILYPEREITSDTIMSNLSRSFTHYRRGAEVYKNVSLKNLRKTYITWVNHAMGKDTGKLTSHSTGNVLQDHYIDSTILTAIEEAVLKVKVFGN